MKSKQDPKVQFGQRLRKLRQAAGFSQEALAYAAELDRSYVGGVERGEYNISLLNICALARALEQSPHELLRLTEDAAPTPARKKANAKSKA
ncbi:MAG: helix-turn-helix transcriptional regulator [Acidobacteriota bacterium]